MSKAQDPRGIRLYHGMWYQPEGILMNNASRGCYHAMVYVQWGDIKNLVNS